MDVTREIRKVVHKQLAKLPDGLRVDVRLLRPCSM